MPNICFIVRLFPVFLMERKLSEYSFPMKIDASNVEVINVPHIKERSPPPCVAYFEARSFTLCKNDLDSNDISDCASM